ncbi:MAG: hypothetical protein ABEI06_05515 [Halobacteriaceae archaeon]
MSESDPCQRCGEPVSDALSRTVRLTVDRSQIDAQRLCPECFAEWIDRYNEQMKQSTTEETDDSEIIID